MPDDLVARLRHFAHEIEFNQIMPEDEMALARQAADEIERLRGRIAEAPTGAWCPQCGPTSHYDEDGDCFACGALAVGDGADLAYHRSARLTSTEAALAHVLALIKDAPHGIPCYRGYDHDPAARPCSCWKAAAIRAAVEGKDV